MMATNIQNRLFTVNEYERLYETGIFSPSERTELIEGEIFTMAPIGSRHAATVNLMARLFIQSLDGKAITSIQNSIPMNDLSEPQPDLVVLEYREDFYKHKKPKAANVIFIVEVSDSSLRFDRQVKGPLYARHGIPEYWVVDLIDEQIIVFREPSANGYQQEKHYRKEDTVVPLHFPDFGVTVCDVV